MVYGSLIIIKMEILNSQIIVVVGSREAKCNEIL